jgi:L-aminopeptidase/D-esterase-like protein
MSREPMRALAAVVLFSSPAAAAPRARDLGIPFELGIPGPLNTITDVPGVEVGQVTLVEGKAVRTGVTVVLPRGSGDAGRKRCFGGFFSLNGNGDMTGTHWLEETGLLDGPVAITNTNSVGVVRDAVIQWAARKWGPKELWSLPVVAETWDGHLNDIYGNHVKGEHLFAAIERARGGAVEEGGVGGGTGMICYEYKGGIGTSSRRLEGRDGGYTLGVLVQANFGRRSQLLIAGIPVGRELTEDRVYDDEDGSVIVVVATDAPVLPHQLKGLARRGALGLARTGTTARQSSGDLLVAFSTANEDAGETTGTPRLVSLPNERLDPLYEAAVAATEEAVINALVAGRAMTGIDGHRVVGLPHDKVREILRRHGRLRTD